MATGGRTYVDEELPLIDIVIFLLQRHQIFSSQFSFYSVLVADSFLYQHFRYGPMYICNPCTSSNKLFMRNTG